MVAMKDGERGRNRTYNLLIKSQLLCQLSYAPTANSKVGTNFDCTIGFASACARLSPSFAISLDPILKLGGAHWTDFTITVFTITVQLPALC